MIYVTWTKYKKGIIMIYSDNFGGSAVNTWGAYSVYSGFDSR